MTEHIPADMSSRTQQFIASNLLHDAFFKVRKSSQGRTLMNDHTLAHIEMYIAEEICRAIEEGRDEYRPWTQWVKTLKVKRSALDPTTITPDKWVCCNAPALREYFNAGDAKREQEDKKDAFCDQIRQQGESKLKQALGRIDPDVLFYLTTCHNIPAEVEETLRKRPSDALRALRYRLGEDL